MTDELKLASIFGSNMVLQRGRPVRVWGQARAGAAVEVLVAGHRSECNADETGAWTLELPELRAGGPYELHVRSGDEERRLSNVLVGEVWVCSGQSNMEWTIQACGPERAPTPARSHPTLRIFTVAKNNAAQPTTELTGRWQVASPETIESFSAVAFYFGRELERALDVPIGLISTNWGGTTAEAWTPREALAAEPSLAQYADAAFETPPGPHIDPGNGALAEGWAKRDHDESNWKPIDLPVMWQAAGMRHNGAVWFRRHVRPPADWAGEPLTLCLGAVDDFDVTYFNNHEIGRTGEETPGFWSVRRKYVVPAQFVRGDDNVIAVRVFDQWGDGGFTGPAASMQLNCDANPAEQISLAGRWVCRVEHELPLRATPGNVGPTMLYNGMIHPIVGLSIAGVIWYQGESNAQRGREYRTLLPTMIRAWRDRWNQGDFPFLIVQLANFGQADSVDASAWAELREAQHHVAATEPNCGIACALDLGHPTDIHPRNKRDVGIRLAHEAMRVAYGHKDAPRSPAYQSYKVVDRSVEITFDHAEAGLRASGAVLGFYVAGEDRVFKPARATIDGSRVIVSADGVERPAAVRYAWRGDPEHSLRGANGLPVFPFRTDDW